MAKDFAIGMSLEIPESVLSNIEKVDKKLQDLEKRAGTTESAFNRAFSNIGESVGSLLNKLSMMDSVMSGIGKGKSIENISKNLSNTASQAEKAADSITKMASMVNKMGGMRDSGFNPESGVLTWQNLQKSIEQVEERQRQLIKTIREYEGELARIQAGKGGVLTKEMRESYQPALKELELNKQLIESYREKQKAIAATLAQQKRLVEYESQRTSLPEQRASDDLKRLNEYYKSLERSSAAAAAAEEKAAERRRKAEEKAAAAAEKAAQRQEAARARLDSRLRKSNYQSYVTSTEGSLRTAGRANTYIQREQAIKNLEAAMKRLRATDANYQKDLNALSAAHKKLTAEQEAYRKSMGLLSQNQSRLMDTADQLKRKLALVFSVSQIQGYMKNLVNVTGEFELQNTALASILKNKNQADILFQQIQDLAVQSPFTVKELTTYTKSLSAYGLEYDKLYDTMKRLADVSAGLGVDMQRLILAYGQVKAANVLRGTETRQFSEAGLNILEELSKYYTEVEGKAVSLSEVQDRQFRKMISYEDVAEVFKRLTSEGGMFYQMQERQAETIAGQMSNLQDSVDIMMNSIGQANSGAITAMISTIRTLVENWKSFVSVANGAGVVLAAYTIKSTLAAFSTGKFSKAMIASTASGKGFKSILASLVIQFENIGKFAMSNPILLVAGALITAAGLIYNHAKNVQEAREQYDLFSNSLYDTREELSVMAERINAQNKKINEAREGTKNLKEGTEEFSKAINEVNKQLSKQTANLDELKNKFPEVYKKIVSNADGTVDLTEALEHYNKVLEDTSHINSIAESTTTFFNDGFEQNIKDAVVAQERYNRTVEEGKDVVRSLAGDLKNYFRGQDEDYSALIAKIDKIVMGTGTSIDKYNELISIYEQNVGFTTKFLSGFGLAFEGIYEYAGKYKSSLYEIENTHENLAVNIKDIGKEIRQDFDLTSEEGKARAKEAAEVYLNHLSDVDDETKRFASEELTKIIGIQIDWGSAKEEVNNFVFGDWRDTAVTKGADKNTLKSIKTMSQYASKLRSAYSSTKQELDDVNNALKVQGNLTKEINKAKKDIGSSDKKTSDAAKKRYTQLRNEESSYKSSLSIRKQQLETEKKSLEEQAAAMNISLSIETKRNKSVSKRQKTENKALKDFKERIRLIRQAADEYKNLRQYQSDGEATATVRDMFKGSSIGNIVGEMSFDELGIIDRLRDKELPKAKKLGKEAIDAVQEGIRENQRDIEIRISKKSIEDAKNELDKAFDEYDLSKELLGTGFDKGTIRAIFKIDTTSIDDLKKKIEEMKKRFGELSEEEQNTLEDYSKKLKEIQDNELLERTKKYAEYLKYQYSEATKIMLQLKNDMAEVYTLDLTDMQKQAINQRLQEEANKKLQEQTWKDFKGSDMYTQMFDDLSKVSTKGLDYMVERLEELKDSLNDLDPSDLKEIINQINKIEEEQIKRNPLEGLGSDIKDALEFAKERKELEEQITDEYEKQKTLIEQIPQQEQTTEESRKNYEKVISVFGEDSDQAQAAKNNLSEQEKTLANMKQDLSDSEKKSEELKDNYEEGAKAAENIKNKTAEFANKINQSVGSMKTLVDGLNSVFNMSDGFNDTMSSIMEFGTNMANTITSAGAAFAGFASGTPIGIFTGITQSVSAIGGLFSSIGSIFNIGDKKKEREIQRHLELVESLQYAYEKLEKAIDDAYSLDTYKAANDKAIENLEKQRESLKRAIAAERDKKDVDENRIKEWERDIDNIGEQIAQLKEDAYNTFTGGIFGDIISASETFVEAWKNAFDETGDGLIGLEDSFNDMLNTLLKRQATMSLITPVISKWSDALKKYVNENDQNLDTDEAAKWVDYIKSTLPQMNESLENYFNSLKEAGLDITPGGDELSGLQKGIQSITEETAQALEAILESIRYFVSDENSKITSLLNVMSSLVSNDAAMNPMLAELQAQTIMIRSIEGMMSSVIKVSSGKGRVMRVEIV
mgnify:CR=1 FL=1